MNNLFGEFQEFRKILCVCPCCGELVRLSDLHLSTKGKVAKTWLDDYDKKDRLLGRKEERFEEREQKLREMAVEKGRKAAQITFNKAISPQLKALKLDPFDVKPILNPIDFVVFNGMNKNDSVNDIILLSKQIKNPELNQIRQQVKKSIVQNKYEWLVARIDDNGKIKFE